MNCNWKAGFGRLARVMAVAGLFVGCSSAVLHTETSTSAISAAEAVGADAVPQAALHLQLAREQLVQARALAEKGEKELAESMLKRVVADAELAVLIANESFEKKEALAAIELVEQLRLENQLAPANR